MSIFEDSIFGTEVDYNFSNFFDLEDHDSTFLEHSGLNWGIIIGKSLPMSDLFCHDELEMARETSVAGGLPREDSRAGRLTDAKAPVALSEPTLADTLTTTDDVNADPGLSSVEGSAPEMSSSPPLPPNSRLAADRILSHGSISNESGVSCPSEKTAVVLADKADVKLARVGTSNNFQGLGIMNSRQNVIRESIDTPLEKSVLTFRNNNDLALQRTVGVPSMYQLMYPQASGVDTDTFFDNVEEANAHTAYRVDLPVDTTLPQTDLQKRAIVKALCDAMSSVDEAEDNPGMIKPFIEGKYDPVRVEIHCWNILQGCIDRHTCGPLQAIYGIKPKQSGQIETFAERMARILDCLKTQKTICKHLLDPSYIACFIDDPVAAYKRVVANKSLNKRKGEVMNAGKMVLNNSRRPSSGMVFPSAGHELVDVVRQTTPFGTSRRSLADDRPATTTTSLGFGGLSMSSPLPATRSPSSVRNGMRSYEASPMKVVQGQSAFTSAVNLRQIPRHVSKVSVHGSPAAEFKNDVGCALPHSTFTDSPVSGCKSGAVVRYMSNAAARSGDNNASHPDTTAVCVSEPVTPSPSSSTYGAIRGLFGSGARRQASGNMLPPSTPSSSPWKRTNIRRLKRTSSEVGDDYLPSSAAKKQR